MSVQRRMPGFDSVFHCFAYILEFPNVSHPFIIENVDKYSLGKMVPTYHDGVENLKLSQMCYVYTSLIMSNF